MQKKSVSSKGAYWSFYASGLLGEGAVSASLGAHLDTVITLFFVITSISFFPHFFSWSVIISPSGSASLWVFHIIHPFTPIPSLQKAKKTRRTRGGCDVSLSRVLDTEPGDQQYADPTTFQRQSEMPATLATQKQQQHHQSAAMAIHIPKLYPQ